MAQEPGFCMIKWAGVLIFPNPTPWMRCMKDRGTCRSPQQNTGRFTLTTDHARSSIVIKSSSLP